MVPDYSGRKLALVEAYSFSRNFTPNGVLVSSIVEFQLTGRDGSDSGPAVKVQLAIPDDPLQSVEAVEADFLTAAFAVLQRVVSDPSVDLPALHRATREKALLQPSE